MLHSSISTGQHYPPSTKRKHLQSLESSTHAQHLHLHIFSHPHPPPYSPLRTARPPPVRTAPRRRPTPRSRHTTTPPLPLPLPFPLLPKHQFPQHTSTLLITTRPRRTRVRTRRLFLLFLLDDGWERGTPALRCETRVLRVDFDVPSEGILVAFAAGDAD